MKALLKLEDPIRTTRGEATRVLRETLMSKLTLHGSRVDKIEEEYTKLALDLADALVTRVQPAGQRQDSVTDQLRDLISLANQEGMYDAVDWIRGQVDIET